ncbi:hypothetical protein ACNAWD_13415 [Rhodococcus erythropolis]|uniref:hypothetical protein n=1 Tax=Rhodococcus erythropolis TaxID=1833 RepID=UPI003A4D34EE
MISLSSRGAEGLGSAADLEDPARSGPVERMSAPAEFHRSGVVVHHQDFCAPSGLGCEPEAALDPAALERRGRVRAGPASAGTFGDTYGTVVLRGHAKHLGGAMFPGQWFGSSGFRRAIGIPADYDVTGPAMDVAEAGNSALNARRIETLLNAGASKPWSVVAMPKENLVMYRLGVLLDTHVRSHADSDN